MKRTTIIYWVLTVLVSLALGIGSIFNVISSPPAVELISVKLGYPAYLVPFLGVAKLLGIIVLLIPGFPRLKEWAYAGLVYDLVGAMYSHYSISAPLSEWVQISILILILMGSYIFHHRRLKATAAQ